MNAVKFTEQTARENYMDLSHNSYPGRGIIIGQNDGGTDMIQIYWIMGRSEGSRNRVFKTDGGRLYTEVADPKKHTGDPKLVIYNAMRKIGFNFIVSNGHQTDTIAEELDDFKVSARTQNLSNVLVKPTVERPHGWIYEPDAPNFTPRISGVCSIGAYHPLIQLAILRKSPWDKTCDVNCYEYRYIDKGFGYCITTYTGDGNPLPSFTGEPLLMPLQGHSVEIGETYWQTLNQKNRVALAVKAINKETGESTIKVWNKYQKV